MSDASGSTSPVGSTSSPGRDDSYVVVARRYRPRGFEQLVGQDHVAKALRNAIETNRVGHAYLFTGARGVGKTSTARIFAKALNDPAGPTPTPDHGTDVAMAIDAGEDVDVIEIDGASNRGIDEIRSLRANVGVRPSRSRYKIYIIDEVHMLTPAAFNALLKTLEEPPEHVKFIFCTTDPEKIPITVLSRCQRFDFAPVELDKIVHRLREIISAENAEADDDALGLIARRASGSMRDSQSLLEQVLSFSDGRLTAAQVHSMLGTADDDRLHSLARAMADRDAAETLIQLDRAIDAGVDAGRLAEQLLGYFRDLMAVAVGCDAALMRHASVALHGELATLAERWGLQTVLAVVGLIDQTLVRIRHSVHGRVLLESALIQICTLPDLQAISDLAAAASEAPAGGSRSEKKKRPVAEPQGAEPAPPRKSATPVNGESYTDPGDHAVPAPHHQNSRTEARRQPSAATAAAPRQQPTMAPSGEPRTANGNRIVSPESHASPEPSQSAAAVDPAVLTSSAEAPTQPFPAAGRGLVSADLDSIWQQALGQMDQITATLARGVVRVEAADSGTLRLIYPGEATLAMRRCDTPENKTEIASTVSRIVGERIAVELKALPTKTERTPALARQSGKSRMQRMRDIEANDLVKACVDLFSAEIVRVDVPRD